MTSYQESDAASSQEKSQSSLGCLIPLIASTVVLALAVTLVSWLVMGGESEPGDEEVVEVEDRSQTDQPESGGLLDIPAQRDGSVSAQALLEVIRSGGWQEFGHPEVFDLGSQQRVVRKFRRNGEHIRVTLHSFKSAEKTQPALEQAELPARAVQFDNKVVVIEPITKGSTEMVDPLADRLRKFKNLLDEQ